MSVMLNNLKLWLAYKLCPELRDELISLRNANTKLCLRLAGDERYLQQ